MTKSIFSDGFWVGINYWGSKNAINMWNEFDAESIERDLILLKNSWITHLRIFPLWSVFQPLTALHTVNQVYGYRFGEDPLPDTPAGKAGVSEEACADFQVFCRLAEKHGFKLIVALITGQMSFRVYTPPAFEGKNLLSDPLVLKWQIRFVRYFVSCFKDEPAIVGWDLGNEVSTMASGAPDSFYVWCAAISDAIRVSDQKHPVISGLAGIRVEQGHANRTVIGENCDVHTTHPYNIFSTNTDPLCSMKAILDLVFQCRFEGDVSGLPTFVQEFGWNPYFLNMPLVRGIFIFLPFLLRNIWLKKRGHSMQTGNLHMILFTESLRIRQRCSAFVTAILLLLGLRNIESARIPAISVP